MRGGGKGGSKNKKEKDNPPKSGRIKTHDKSSPFEA